MGILGEMGFCENLDLISTTCGEGEAYPQVEPMGQTDEDCSDEEMEVDELERRMWRDKMLLRKLKERKKTRMEGLMTWRSTVSLRNKHGGRKCPGHKMAS